MSDEEGSGAVVGAGSSQGEGHRQSTEIVEAALAVYRQGGDSGISPEVARNLRPDHIDKALDYADNSHRRLGEDRQDSRRVRLYAFVGGGILVIVVVALLLFTDNGQILADNLDVVLSFRPGPLAGMALEVAHPRV